MTTEQHALYEYGNQVGGDIQGFELSHPNQPATLQDFAEDRTNATKIAAMKKLGADYVALGDLIASTDPVPTQMKSAQDSLAASYRDIGTKLGQIPDANKSNASLVQAMLTYDATAERYVDSFVNFAQIFSANGVKFSNSDAGSAFVFQNAPSL